MASTVGCPGLGDPGPGILLIFAKAPVPGQVKTRLAAGVGAEEAARIYRWLGTRVLEGLRGGRFRPWLCHAPDDAAGAMRDWLGGDLELRPQGDGDLGQRMERAFERAFAEASRVCIVGTDALDVDRVLVERALALLSDHDAVLGPARDGGYYLLALRAHCPDLFRDVPWSTPAVLGATLERARRAGLRVALLPVLADVDTAEDLPPGLRAAIAGDAVAKRG